MRPVDVKMPSWEGTLFLFARWPWSLIGTIAAVRDWVGKIGDAGPRAIEEQKRLMQVWENCSASGGIAAGIDSFANAYEDGGVEPKEYMGRFLKSKK